MVRIYREKNFDKLIGIAKSIVEEMREREDNRHNVSDSAELIRNSLQYQPDNYHR